MEPIIRVNNIKYIYPDKTQVYFNNLDLTVHQGERVALLGANGAGKTTLLLLILGILSPMDGEINVFGYKPHKNFNKIRKHIGALFQNVDEQIIGPTVFDDIAFALRNQNIPEKEVKNEVLALANKLRIDNLLNKIPHYLSGGQKKKVALAGAIITKPKILILDEPFNSLDSKSKWDMISILNKLNKEFNITLISTTHHMDLVSEIADTVYLLGQKELLTKGTSREVFSQVDKVRAANLELPIMVELFDRLKKRGYMVNLPISLEEAEDEIIRLLELKEKKVSF